MIDGAGASPVGAPDTGWRAGDHVRWRREGETLFVLDLRRNRYLAFEAPDRIWSETLIAKLERAGLGHGFSAVKSTRHTGPNRTTPGALSVIRACLWARTMMKRGALAEAVSMVERGEAGCDASPAIAAFECWRDFYPRDRDCLFDSLVLGRLLSQSGASVELVFAIRPKPFAAHCWLEQDGRLIHDDPAYCATFGRLGRDGDP